MELIHLLLSFFVGHFSSDEEDLHELHLLQESSDWERLR